MSADRDIRRLNKLLDVSSAGIAAGDVPTWDGIASFTMGPSGSGGFDMTVGGNSTSGGAGFALISTGTMTLAGGTNITLSQDGNAVTIMGGAGGGTQTFIGGISASNTDYTSGTVEFVGSGGGITVGSAAGQKVVLSVASPVSQTVQTQSRFDLTLGGNSTSAGAGFIEVSSGTMTLAGGTNITLSQDGNAVTIMGGAGGGGTQTAISGIVASNATYTSGTVTFTGVGGGVTVSSNTGQRVDISVAAPVAQTNQAGTVFAVSNTFGTSSGTYDARTLSIAGVGAVNVAASNSGWRISAPVQTNQSGSVFASSNTFGTSSGTYDARTLSIAGSGIVSVAASNSGFVINASTAAQTNQSGSVFASSNTFGTSSGTYDARTLSIAGSGAVSVAASNSGWVISAPVAVAQTNQTGSVFAASNTTGTSSGTYDARTLSIAGDGIISVAASNSGWRISATTAAQTNQSGNVYASSNTFGTSSGTYDARSLSVAGSGGVRVAASNSGWVVSAPVLTVSGNSTSGGAGFILLSSGTLALAGGPNITLSQDGNTVSVSAPSAGAASFSVGVSSGGNTTGNTGVTGTRIVFAGTNNITLSQATDATGATISISGGPAFSAGVSTGGNTTGNTGVTGTRLVFAGSSPITLSQATDASGGTISVQAPATSSLSGTGQVSISTNGSTISIGVPDNSIAFWQNIPVAEAVLMTHVSDISKVPIYWGEEIDGRITANSLAFRVSNVTASQPNSFSVHLGVYTLVNSTSAALLGSLSEAYVISSASSVSFSGIRNYAMTGIGTHATISTLSAGHYLLGMMVSATATNAMNFSLMGAGSSGGPLGLILPGTNLLSTGTSQGIQGLWGRGSTTVNAMPANVQASEIVNQGQGASMQLHPWIFIRS